MPKSTFYNLSQDKRILIEEVAIDEFSTYGYDKASISRIVEESQIAKGSFYQYFQDKEDLFAHIINRSIEDKINYLSPLIQKSKENELFTLLKELYIGALKFAEDNPKLVIIGNIFLKSKDHPVYKEVIEQNMNKSYELFEKLLTCAISRGEVRNDIDKSFVSYLMSSMNIAVVEYYFSMVKEKHHRYENKNIEMVDTVNLFIDFIKKGIENKEVGL